MSEPITGVGGKVSIGGTELADVKKFQVTRKADVKKYGSSSTGAGKKTLKGRTEWDISFTVALPDGSQNHSFSEGDLVAFVGTTTAGKTFSGNCRIEQISEAMDVEGANELVADVTAAGDGDYTIT